MSDMSRLWVSVSSSVIKGIWTPALWVFVQIKWMKMCVYSAQCFAYGSLNIHCPYPQESHWGLKWGRVDGGSLWGVTSVPAGVVMWFDTVSLPTGRLWSRQAFTLSWVRERGQEYQGGAGVCWPLRTYAQALKADRQNEFWKRFCRAVWTLFSHQTTNFMKDFEI